MSLFSVNFLSIFWWSQQLKDVSTHFLRIKLTIWDDRHNSLQEKRILPIVGIKTSKSLFTQSYFSFFALSFCSGSHMIEFVVSGYVVYLCSCVIWRVWARFIQFTVIDGKRDMLSLSTWYINSSGCRNLKLTRKY